MLYKKQLGTGRYKLSCKWKCKHTLRFKQIKGLEWDCGIFLLPHATIKPKLSDGRGNEYTIEGKDKKRNNRMSYERAKCQHSVLYYQTSV